MATGIFVYDHIKCQQPLCGSLEPPNMARILREVSKYKDTRPHFVFRMSKNAVTVV